jgi:hypothetical protein
MESTYHYEETIEKRIWRAVCVEVIREQFPNGIPKGQKAVILGGEYADKRGNLIQGSEVDQLLRSGLVKPKQIISVDCNPDLVKQLDKNKLGIRNIYMPLSHKLDEKDCPVLRGEVGGLERVVMNLVGAGEILAYVNADLMGTHIREGLTCAGIASALNHQKENAILILNINSHIRNAKDKNDRGRTEYGVSFDLCRHSSYREAIRKSKFNPSAWSEIPMTINERHTFEYVSDHAPMQSVFLLKEKNPDYVGERVMVEVKATKHIGGGKGQADPEKWRLAGLKAYETRLRNQKLAGVK